MMSLNNESTAFTALGRESGQAQGLLRALRQPQESPRPWDDACDSVLRDTINRLLRRGIDGETISRSLYRLSQSY